jgi:hypothetical protein
MAFPNVSAVMPVPSETKKTDLLVMFSLYSFGEKIGSKIE